LAKAGVVVAIKANADKVSKVFCICFP